ncbi:peptide-methionine (S)-S-oxide reductase MsrA [Wenzhouxiangella sp. XN24]|uniref:peptide-methionine (S)-S-oxide reductase MsrA n=1 Tax=Wenzhouxiangella sp. XN24 TaxID=2713569 RepID=UPI0013ED73D8|nr:peptide-methionine (S)-S-oxide reductase MsrA [Wenzhouxiangella sp. XN24]NGX15372.1 peptide-methionine (S)-S-oxide reductase MsrA [Wenzhouxiangella sp. XN24]
MRGPLYRGRTDRTLFGRLLLGMLLAVSAGVVTSQAEEADAGDHARATFAGGCFWCMEPPFDKLDGVIATTSGYAGGPEPDPTYRDVVAGRTGHAEVVQVTFDPARISYDELLRVFWRNIDPFVVDRQFCDRGAQYRTAIFYHDDAQRVAAEASLAEVVARFDRAVETEIEAEGGTFHPAEAYHQDYYLENPLRYRYYRFSCGRDSRLEEIWGDEAGG